MKGQVIGGDGQPVGVPMSLTRAVRNALAEVKNSCPVGSIVGTEPEDWHNVPGQSIQIGYLDADSGGGVFNPVMSVLRL